MRVGETLVAFVAHRIRRLRGHNLAISCCHLEGRMASTATIDPETWLKSMPKHLKHVSDMLIVGT